MKADKVGKGTKSLLSACRILQGSLWAHFCKRGLQSRAQRLFLRPFLKQIKQRMVSFEPFRELNINRKQVFYGKFQSCRQAENSF
jgi:hypothetical protein